MENVSERSTIKHDFYVIQVTWTTNFGSIHQTGYFKADRYSPYCGRLQVEWEIVDAKPYKTERDARKAMARLLAKGTIKPDNQPVVVHDTETRVRRYEKLPETARVVVGPSEAELDELRRREDADSTTAGEGGVLAEQRRAGRAGRPEGTRDPGSPGAAREGGHDPPPRRSHDQGLAPPHPYTGPPRGEGRTEEVEGRNGVRPGCKGMRPGVVPASSHPPQRDAAECVR